MITQQPKSTLAILIGTLLVTPMLQAMPDHGRSQFIAQEIQLQEQQHMELTDLINGRHEALAAYSVTSNKIQSLVEANRDTVTATLNAELAKDQTLHARESQRAFEHKLRPGRVALASADRRQPDS